MSQINPMKRALLLLLSTTSSALLFAGCPDLGGEGGAEVAVCDDDTVLDRVVHDTVLQTTCIRCHVSDGLAGGTRLVLEAALGSALEDADALAARNLAVFKPLAKETVLDGLSLVVAKPLGLHPDGHGGGVVVTDNTIDARRLRFAADWINGAVDSCVVPTEFDSGGVCDKPVVPRRFVRLSRDEYAASVAVVLGPVAGARARELARGFPADVVVENFEDRATMAVSELLGEKLSTAAEDIAGVVVDDNNALGTAGGCTGLDRPCAVQLIERAGRRALRRPLVLEERDGLVAIYDGVIDDGDGHKEGLRWALTALLQLPGFLYKEELGRRSDDVFALTDWEVAAALSFVFTGAPPDDALLDAVAAGTFENDRDALVTRLRTDPRTTAQAQRFFAQWLDFDAVVRTPHDAATFPELTPAVIGALRAEADANVGDAVREGGSLRDLLLQERTRIGADLASFYGVAAPGTDGVVDLGGSGYRGLLSMGAFTAGHALPKESSPIRRGVAVRARLLCDPLPPPPPNINAAPPASDPNASTRDRFAQHSSQPECRSCHVRIDGIGFALEGFDGAGRRRETDNGKPLDLAGSIVDIDAKNADVTDVHGLAALLADSPQVGACYVDSWARFGAGVDPETLGCSLTAPPLSAAVLDAPTSLVGVFAKRSGASEEPEGYAPAADAVLEPVEPVDPGEPVVGGVVVTTRETNRWNAGACFAGDVDNGTDGDAGWSVDIAVEGTVNNHWNSSIETLENGKVRFSGADWNVSLAPGSHADVFGFCVDF